MFWLLLRVCMFMEVWAWIRLHVILLWSNARQQAWAAITVSFCVFVLHYMFDRRYEQTRVDPACPSKENTTAALVMKSWLKVAFTPLSCLGSDVPTPLSRSTLVNPKQQSLPFLRSFKKPQQPIRKVGTMKTLTRTCLGGTLAGYWYSAAACKCRKMQLCCKAQCDAVVHVGNFERQVDREETAARTRRFELQWFVLVAFQCFCLELIGILSWPMNGYSRQKNYLA